MRTVTCVLLTLTVAACATSYKPVTMSGGYSDVRLDANVFRVSFQGNGFTSASRVEEMTLLRSADVAMRNGFTHFIIVDARAGADYATVAVPAQAYTTGTANVIGSTVYTNATTTYTGGGTYVIARPSSSNTIVCFEGKPQAAGMVYDAKLVFDSLAGKYHVKRPAP